MQNSIYLKHFEKKFAKTLDTFSVGDYIKVGFLFNEGSKKRVQFFEGIVIGINKSYFDKKVILRKPGIYAVERIFSIKNPHIQNLKIIYSKNFNKSKLFYLRKRIGKEAFGLKEKKLNKLSD